MNAMPEEEDSSERTKHHEKATDQNPTMAQRAVQSRHQPKSA
jgi:hypothetical protein